jgi:hypothetical protein
MDIQPYYSAFAQRLPVNPGLPEPSMTTPRAARSRKETESLWGKHLQVRSPERRTQAHPAFYVNWNPFSWKSLRQADTACSSYRVPFPREISCITSSMAKAAR